MTQNALERVGHDSQVRIASPPYRGLITGTFLLLAGCVVTAKSYLRANTTIVEILNKEVVHDTRSSTYRIHTSAGIFEVRNHLIHGGNLMCVRLYHNITPGQTYRVKWYGLRLEFLSRFPNIVEALPFAADQYWYGFGR